MNASLFWIAALFAVAIYCIAQAVRDVRAKRYGWAIAAAASAAVILTVPFPTHAIKIDLPQR